MSFIKRKECTKIEIDLSGPEGNAFCLLARASLLAKQLGLDFGPIREDACSSDYEHLLEVLDKHFGNVVDFIR